MQKILMGEVRGRPGERERKRERERERERDRERQRERERDLSGKVTAQIVTCLL